MIEFAPFQKSVKGKVKPDARQGTIDSSPEYKEFLESLAQPASSEPVVSTNDEGPTTTPLIEYLRTQKAVKAEKERTKEKLRLAKLAAAQAKANAPTPRPRAERLQKTDMAPNKPPESSRDGKSTGGRAGRGNKPATRGRDIQRSKAQQPQQAPKKNVPPSAAEKSLKETPPTQIPSPPTQSTPPTMAPSITTETTDGSGSGSQPFRGGRGRGRARGHGVYRSGGGRGGKRGGSGHDTRPSANTVEG